MTLLSIPASELLDRFASSAPTPRTRHPASAQTTRTGRGVRRRG